MEMLQGELFQSFKSSGVAAVASQLCQNGGLTLNWGARYALPGPVQTVPRAELHVIYFVTLHALNHSYIDFVTDNKNNCDIYIIKDLRQVCVQLTVIYLNAFLTTSMIKGWFSQLDGCLLT